MTDTTTSDATPHHEWKWPRARWIVLAIAFGITMLWLTPILAQWVAGTDLEDLDHLYGIVFLCVTFDAIIPAFPSESLLNATSALAATDGSTIVLWKLIVAGAAGAIVGDSLLYWLARTVLRPAMSERVDQAMRNDKIALAMHVMNRNAPMLIVFGRYVPGLRFMVGATMGLTKFPYGRFLRWDIVSGILWATYTCVLAYLVGSVLDDKPLASAVIAGLVTTVILIFVYQRLKRSWQRTEAATATT